MRSPGRASSASGSWTRRRTRARRRSRSSSARSKSLLATAPTVRISQRLRLRSSRSRASTRPARAGRRRPSRSPQAASKGGRSAMSVLIKGGRILTAADDYVGDVYVEGERISLIGESLDVAADRVVDARGKYVLPGCIDPHTHLDMPFGGTVTIDDVESGQISAAFGGTTCHVDFIIQPQGHTFAAALEEWRSKAAGRQVIDMGYHMAVTDLVNGGTLDELATLPEQGIT